MTAQIAFFLVFLALLVWAIRAEHWLFAFIAGVMLATQLGSQHNEPQRSAVDYSARDYRAAQDAVAKATGRPCDYACKEMIADQARRVQTQ